MNEEEDILSLFDIVGEESQPAPNRHTKKAYAPDEQIKVSYAEMLPKKTHKNKEKTVKSETNEKYISLKKAAPILIVSFFAGFGIMLWLLWR